MRFRSFLISLIVSLSGFAIAIIGTLFKIMHWRFSAEVFTLGAGLMVLGIVLGIIKLIQIYRKGN
ncbi:MAG: GldL-related protein [Aquaticitalea sp.]